MAEMDRTTEEIENELKLLEENIVEVRRRLPAHSVKPPIMMELLELEDRRDVLLRILEKRYVCLKHDITMCEKCLRCRDPEIYCKHRHACTIHFLTRRKGSLEDAPHPRQNPKDAARGC
jgi:hypothetical protein